MTPDEYGALQRLADVPRGIAKTLMLAHGFIQSVDELDPHVDDLTAVPRVLRYAHDAVVKHNVRDRAGFGTGRRRRQRLLRGAGEAL